MIASPLSFFQAAICIVFSDGWKWEGEVVDLYVKWPGSSNAYDTIQHEEVTMVDDANYAFAWATMFGVDFFLVAERSQVVGSAVSRAACNCAVLVCVCVCVFSHILSGIAVATSETTCQFKNYDRFSGLVVSFAPSPATLCRSYAPLIIGGCAN